MMGKRSAKKLPILRIAIGYPINQVDGEAGGLAILEKIHAQVRGLHIAMKNIQDGIALIQIIQEALNEIHVCIQNMRELAIEAASDTLTVTDREQCELDFQKLQYQIQCISTDTHFNKKALINGDYVDGGLKIHVGANSGQNIELHINDMGVRALAIDHASVGLWEYADQAINTMDAALNKVSYERTRLETYQNWLERTGNSHQKTMAQLQDTELHLQDIGVRIREIKSRIRHTYVANKRMERIRLKLILRISQTMLVLHMQKAHTTVKALEQVMMKGPEH
ncbi:flagellin N-terminal helical domain-containing protein [Lysinibacillus piscis]|nr:flagellin [Lysinibacillus sp. KH24]